MVRFEPQSPTFDADELCAAVIGRSGNLRAPAIRSGRTWLVGFHEGSYAERFGG
ncbi:MAG: hypothetical protein KDE27_03665 [Planctomycetes bacterium]|nr:hypothetical protein [Planctomycetota bacterium]